VKNPPHTYIQKLRSFLDPAVTRKVSSFMLHMLTPCLLICLINRPLRFKDLGLVSKILQGMIIIVSFKALGSF